MRNVDEIPDATLARFMARVYPDAAVAPSDFIPGFDDLPDGAAKDALVREAWRRFSKRCLSDWIREHRALRP